MTTLADDIQAAAQGDTITRATIGQMGWPGYGEDERHTRALAHSGEVLTWTEARPLLDFEYDDGYGAPDIPAIHAWTNHRVIFIVQCDGSTSVHSVPRHPSATVPEMPGG